jgi:hypothetical protein
MFDQRNIQNFERSLFVTETFTIFSPFHCMGSIFHRILFQILTLEFAWN